MSRPAEPEPAPRLRTRDAIALGLLHGPAELLPISSSGHTALVPWLLDWPYAELDGELRMSFEVALHAGALAALLIGLRDEVAAALRALDARGLRVLALSSLPPAVVGLAFEGTIKRRLGGPAGVAAGLIAGALVMGACDIACSGERTHADARARDGLALGVAQACALIPGVSRSGATLAAARARGFARVDASILSRHVALPVLAGATALRGLRIVRHGLPAGAARGFAAGTAASFAATLASTRILRTVERHRALAPFAAYRIALAGLVLARLRRVRDGRCVACDIDHPPAAAQ